MNKQPPEPQGQAQADIEAGRASITALRDEAREYGRMPFKVRDMHVSLLHRLLDRLGELQPRRAAQAEVSRDGNVLPEQRRDAQGEPPTREWCMAAAKAEEAAGDPDCTTGQPSPQGQAALVREKLVQIHKLADAASEWSRTLGMATSRTRVRTLAREALDALGAVPAPRQDVEALMTQAWNDGWTWRNSTNPKHARYMDAADERMRKRDVERRELQQRRAAQGEPPQPPAPVCTCRMKQHQVCDVCQGLASGWIWSPQQVGHVHDEQPSPQGQAALVREKLGRALAVQETDECDRCGHDRDAHNRKRGCLAPASDRFVCQCRAFVEPTTIKLSRTLAREALDALGAAQATPREDAEAPCEFNAAETWCLTHHCYPRTCRAALAAVPAPRQDVEALVAQAMREARGQDWGGDITNDEAAFWESAIRAALARVSAPRQDVEALKASGWYWHDELEQWVIDTPPHGCVTLRQVISAAEVKK